jgi:hypothetical protein
VTDPYAEVRALLIPGKRLRVGYPPPGIMQIVHVRAIVDDQYVVRHWSERKRRWIYTVEPIYYFHNFYTNGGLTPAGKS